MELLNDISGGDARCAWPRHRKNVVRDPATKWLTCVIRNGGMEPNVSKSVRLLSAVFIVTLIALLPFGMKPSAVFSFHTKMHFNDFSKFYLFRIINLNLVLGCF